MLAFFWLAPLKKIAFLTITNESIFLKTQGTRLDTIVTPNKGLEWALIFDIYIYIYINIYIYILIFLYI